VKPTPRTQNFGQVPATFPRSELFGLTSQLRRAAISIPSNLAEGSARRTTPDFLAFVHIARGSQAELDTQLRLARDFGYLSEATFSELHPLQNGQTRGTISTVAMPTTMLNGVPKRM
jgi:four helix bundle protein